VNHYVYYSYEEWGRGYIGVRSCKGAPEEDASYLGSFKDKTFKPTQKIILQTFRTRADANAAEIILHNFYDVAVNLNFANKAKSTATGFCRAGIPLTTENREKLKKINKGKGNPNYGKPKSIETRKKQSNALKGRVFSNKTKLKMKEAKKNQMVSICLRCLKTNQVFCFNSVNEAAQNLNLNPGNISNLLHGRGKTVKGFALEHLDP
jgi:group I intron endonuclease